MPPECDSPCLNRDQLEALASGETIDGVQAVHVGDCKKCSEALAGIRGENAFLEEFIGANADLLEQPELQDQPIDGYTVKRELHRGGQGIVYEAEQITTRRAVAIKMMLQGKFATSQQRQRFEREIEVVAALRHPGIVTLFESGRTRRGELYFAMEFIDGRTLDIWSANANATLRERVVLFSEICAAVQYAHGRGIIHRDMKPGNVLIDHENHAHVMDFGLARINDNGADPDHLSTRAGEFLGTFSYAAPEQLQGENDRIDVRTDVFALGVLLYEMLAGERPFKMGDSLAELIANRLETIPPPPSSKTRGIDRDLDVICMKALAPEQDRRYGSAGELHSDLERYLDGRAILARADSTAYVLNRMVARHKVLVSAVALLLLFAIGSAIGFAILFAQAEQARKASDDTLRGFQDSIGLINPETGQGTREMSVSEYVQLVEAHVAQELDTQPRVGAALLTTLGLIELAFEEYERAEVLLVEAQRLRLDGPDAPLGEAHHNLGRVYYYKREFERARDHYEKALALRIAAHGVEHDDVAMTYQHLGSCNRRLGDYTAAASHYDSAETIFRALHGNRSAFLAGLHNNRAMFERALASREEDEAKQRAGFERALSMLRGASAMIRSIAPANDYRIGRSERSIGFVLSQLGKHEEAIGRFNEAQRILSSRGGPSAEDVLQVIDLRAKSRIAIGIELDETVEELAFAASEHEARGERWKSGSPWRRAASSWSLLATVEEQRGNLEEAQAARTRAEEATVRAESAESAESAEQ